MAGGLYAITMKRTTRFLKFAIVLAICASLVLGQNPRQKYVPVIAKRHWIRYLNGTRPLQGYSESLCAVTCAAHWDCKMFKHWEGICSLLQGSFKILGLSTEPERDTIFIPPRFLAKGAKIGYFMQESSTRAPLLVFQMYSELC